MVSLHSNLTCVSVFAFRSFHALGSTLELIGLAGVFHGVQNCCLRKLFENLITSLSLKSPQLLLAQVEIEASNWSFCFGIITLILDSFSSFLWAIVSIWSREVVLQAPIIQ